MTTAPPTGAPSESPSAAPSPSGSTAAPPSRSKGPPAPTTPACPEPSARGAGSDRGGGPSGLGSSAPDVLALLAHRLGHEPHAHTEGEYLAADAQTESCLEGGGHHQKAEDDVGGRCDPGQPQAQGRQ